MSIQYICDATGQILDKPVSLSFYRHIIDIGEGNFRSGYRVSQAFTEYHVSQEIYNRVMVAAYEEFKRIKEENSDV